MSEDRKHNYIFLARWTRWEVIIHEHDIDERRERHQIYLKYRKKPLKLNYLLLTMYSCSWCVADWYQFGLVCLGLYMCVFYLCLSIMNWPCTSLCFSWSHSFQLSLGHTIFSTLLFVFVSKCTNDTNTFLSPKVTDWV